jgi:hypothetical protein
MKNEKKDTRVGIEEHEKVVDVFIQLVLVQLAVTPYVYKEQLDFLCKKEGWIHGQNPSLGRIRMGGSELFKTVRSKTCLYFVGLFLGSKRSRVKIA